MNIPRFYLANLKSLLMWPAMAATLIVLLWGGIFIVLSNEKERTWRDAEEMAASRSRGFASQLQRSIQQIDQLVLSLKHDWEDSSIKVNLERQRKQGLYPPENLVYAAIAGADGLLQTSTIDLPGKPDFSDTTFFRFHRDNVVRDLVISEPEIARRIKRPVIRFTRRLDKADGSFDGVAWASVEPRYLLAFYDESRLARGDFIAVRFAAGGPLTAGHGGGDLALPFYRGEPAFRQTAGVSREPAEKFRDNLPRLVAWKTLEKYPLVALTAFSEANLFRQYDRLAARYREGGLLASATLLLIAAAGVLQSVKLARRKEEEERAKDIFRLAVDGAREGFYTLQPVLGTDDEIQRLRILDCNERGATLLGRAKDDVVGTDFMTAFGDEHHRRSMHFFYRALTEGFHEDEMRVPPHSWIRASWIHRKAVRSGTSLAVSLRDISERKAHEQELSNMANADALTSLPNRHWLTNFLPLALERARHDDTGLALLFIDLDDFKNINDTLGHQADDELLRAAAVRLRSVIRADDHAVRLGGDEFTVVLEQVEMVEEVSRAAKAIVETLAEPFALSGAAGQRVRASIGVSMFPQDGQDSDTLLKHADIAMYAAKAAGKGRFHFYQAHLSDRLMLKISKEEALRNAIENDQFILYYQPRVDAVTGQMSSMEALVRWNHPERGLILPLEFVHVAEDTKLILRHGEMVIAKACAQIAQWKAARLPVVSVSVNVSALQFNEGQVEPILKTYMERYGIEPHLIAVELTESCMVGEGEKVPHELAAVRSLGVKLLVDDFGTGYSSLAQLQRLDVDILKVDRAFTFGLTQGDEGKAFYKAIVSMANALNMGVVAEGVETEEQLALLKSLSCNEVQGNYISVPVPPEEMTSLILKRFLLPSTEHESNTV